MFFEQAGRTAVQSCVGSKSIREGQVMSEQGDSGA